MEPACYPVPVTMVVKLKFVMPVMLEDTVSVRVTIVTELTATVDVGAFHDRVM